MLVMVILTVTLMLVLTFVQISSQQAVLREEVDKRIALMRENLIERGKSFITSLIQQVENDIAAFNFSGAVQSITDSVAQHDDLKYAILLDKEGIVYIHTFHPEFTQRELSDERDRRALQIPDIAVFDDIEEHGEAVVEIVAPLQISTAPWGVLRLVYSLHGLEQEIQRSETQITKQMTEIVSKSIFMSFGFSLLAFVGVFVLSTRFSTPLIQLTHAARRLADGHFGVPKDLRTVSKDEIGVLASSFIEMSEKLKRSYEQLEEYSHTLEMKVDERTKELHASLQQVEKANRKIMQSIEYSQLIQYALLPNREAMTAKMPHHFVIWMPRDVVGGDLYFMESLEDESFIIGVIDCTGHGVPGAFMTMIASSLLTRIIRDDECTAPGEILQRLNIMVKNLLHQDQTSTTLSDNGLDAAICHVNSAEKTLVFSGARLPLLYTKNGDVSVLKGERHSVGYRRSGEKCTFSNQELCIEKDMVFYLLTDGYTDQLGSVECTRFGTKRLKNLLREHSAKPFDLQEKALLHALYEFQGEQERQDDVTVIGFGCHHAFAGHREDAKKGSGDYSVT